MGTAVCLRRGAKMGQTVRQSIPFNTKQAIFRIVKKALRPLFLGAVGSFCVNTPTQSAYGRSGYPCSSSSLFAAGHEKAG